MSVMNITLEKNPLYKVPIEGGSKLLFQIGYRRFEAEPIFSQHNNGNKFKVCVIFILFFFLKQIKNFIIKKRYIFNF